MKKSAFRSLPEASLAGYQTLQTGNDCTMHAISAAVKMLSGFEIDPHDLSKQVDKGWWDGRLFRLLPGSGVLPHMQRLILEWLIEEHHLPLQVKQLHLSPEVLRILPSDDTLAALVTIYWLGKAGPPIYHGTGNFNFNTTKGPSGHTMLMAAYDPGHVNVDGLETPWGFINSWSDGGTDLFWMADDAFRKAWNFRFPWIGKNAAVVVSLKP